MAGGDKRNGNVHNLLSSPIIKTKKVRYNGIFFKKHVLGL